MGKDEIRARLSRMRRLVDDPEQLAEESQQLSRELMEIMINGDVQFILMDEYDPGDKRDPVTVKQEIAKQINAKCRQVGGAIAHPDTDEPCTLLAISDKQGGTFVLENRKTKKRSHTTRDIHTLLPFKI